MVQDRYKRKSEKRERKIGTTISVTANILSVHRLVTQENHGLVLC